MNYKKANRRNSSMNFIFHFIPGNNNRIEMFVNWTSRILNRGNHSSKLHYTRQSRRGTIQSTYLINFTVEYFLIYRIHHNLFVPTLHAHECIQTLAIGKYLLSMLRVLILWNFINIATYETVMIDLWTLDFWMRVEVLRCKHVSTKK